MLKNRFLLVNAIALITMMNISCSGRHDAAESEAVLNTIATRVSVRSYQDKAIDSATIEKLLRAGMAAPSARNLQPWHFIAVTDKTLLQALADGNSHASMLAGAPLAIVVCGNMDKAGGLDMWIQDCAAAAENILLAAHAMGLGAVWTANHPYADRMEVTSEVLHLPQNIVPFCVIPIGYPDGNEAPKDKWNPENVTYNAFADGTAAGQTAGKVAAESDFKEFDITGDFRGNPFTWFKGNGLLLAAGDRQSHNAMTIGWGMLGNIWGEEVNTITVFVAPSRYTQQFMEKHKYFTVMKFDDNQQEILRYMGTNSGRDGDKAEALGLHTAYTEHGAPYYLEAREVYECEIIYRNQFEKTGFSDVPQKRYQNFPAGIHHAYIGKVLEAKRR
ncbi:MAG: nitroreductase family protein [Bacteroidales bacterium]|nr:nitroreductase family protein [Bacteroidales bacterium]